MPGRDAASDRDWLLEQARAALGHGDGARSRALLDAILSRDPDDADALYMMAELAHAAGDRDAAITLLRRVAAVAPHRGRPWFSLGALLASAGAREAAEEALEQAVAVDPDLAEAYVNLGNLRRDDGRLEDAASAYARALELQPGLVEVETNLGVVRQHQGLHRAALAHHDRALAARPDFQLAHHNRLLSLHYGAEPTPREIFEAHVAWARAHADPLTAEAPAHADDRDPDRRLRLGFVSPDFRFHPVSQFFEPFAAALDRDNFTLVCYADGDRRDPVTERIEALADLWRPIARLSDAALAETARSDRIDILVDLAGHTAGNRLLAFARKPAPVQATWLGYPDTTGMAAIDWRITDAAADPPGEADVLSVERLFRLERGFLCYRPHPDAPAVVPPPCLGRGAVTFGSCNNLSKVTDAAIDAWAGILRRVKGSRLLLKARSFNDAATARRVREEFAARGVSAERLDLRGPVRDMAGHLAAYGEVDVALDTFPYNGATTTFDALWMGVPVVSLAGDRHSARVGASILTRLGLHELVASDLAEYCGRALALARNPGRLEDLRDRLRPLLGGSALTDAPRFARAMEAAFREMWRQRRTGEAGAPI